MRWLFWILLIPGLLKAQDPEEPRWTVDGYLKDMLTVNVAGQDSTFVDNLIHHRLNIRYYLTSNLTVKMDFRNRVFFGDLVKAIPNYGEFIDTNNDYLDLSWTPVNKDGLVVHSMIDRAYFLWNQSDWEITLGRQRINWGVNLAWNPNDLFNSYSFFDFDYEERPGSDALRVKKYTGYASEMEFAIKAASSLQDLTSAIRYQLNKWNYDIQFLGGVMKNNLALGTGWAGNIGGMGLKGEVTYLNQFGSHNDGMLASLSCDYMFSNSIYLNGSAMYNDYGSENPNLGLINTASNLDIRSLSPYKWSSFLQLSYPAHPLVNTSLATIFFPSDQSLFINPVVTYSIVSNLDFDVIGQFYFKGASGDSFSAQAKALFFRLKYSY